MPAMKELMRNALLMAALACSTASLAGGPEYGGPDDTENAGPAYFGFVWDQRGSPMNDARVVLRAKNGTSVELKTNVLGLYRSHLGKEVRPEDVEVSCDKPGYKQAKVKRRASVGLSASTVETDCTLQKL